MAGALLPAQAASGKVHVHLQPTATEISFNSPRAHRSLLNPGFDLPGIQGTRSVASSLVEEQVCACRSSLYCLCAQQSACQDEHELQ
jgi:hypothetical protein